MANFQDVKAAFHAIGDWFGTVGNYLNGWPWPLSHLASPFWYFRTLFYSYDWVWNGLDVWLSYITDLWTWAGEFTAWVSNRFWEITNRVLDWSQIEQLIGYALGVYPLTWSSLRLKINQSIAATLGLPEFTWGWLISKIQTEIGAAIDLSWLVTVKFPLINASIADIWNRLADLKWENLIFAGIGTFGVNLNAIAGWFISKRAVLDAWYDTTRLVLEADVVALKKGISIEAIKANLVDWLGEEIDKRWY